MAQKLILCEAATNVDILASSPAIATCLADGFTVSSVSGFTSRDNRNMCFVLLTKTEVAPATEETTPAAETTTTTETTDTTTETEPSGEGGERGEGE